MFSSPLPSVGLYAAPLTSKGLAESEIGVLAKPQQACKYSKDRREKYTIYFFFLGINAQLESYQIQLENGRTFKFLGFSLELVRYVLLEVDFNAKCFFCKTLPISISLPLRSNQLDFSQLLLEKFWIISLL